MSFLRMEELNLAGNRLLIREDFNVPVEAGKVTSDKRIRAALPTVEQALERGAAVMLMSHLGRPTEGQFADEYSLAPVAECLSGHLGLKVRLVRDWLDGVDVGHGEVARLEDVHGLPAKRDAVDRPRGAAEPRRAFRRCRRP